jgi:hypothetical protein
MKKAILVLTPDHMPAHELRFAIESAKSNAWHLHGVFITNTESHIEYPFPNDYALTSSAEVKRLEEEENRRIAASNIALFSKYCENEGVGYDVNSGTSFTDLLTLSASAALVIINKNIESYHFTLAELLAKAHCPVYIDSPAVSELKRVILTYDGSDSSRAAIEAFATVFPGLCLLQTDLVSINAGLELLEHKEFITQYLRKKFPQLQNHQLEGDLKDETEQFIRKTEHSSVVVMGSFGRSWLSRLLHSSLGKDVLSHTSASVFIAHRPV